MAKPDDVLRGLTNAQLYYSTTGPSMITNFFLQWLYKSARQIVSIDTFPSVFAFNQSIESV